MAGYGFVGLLAKAIPDLNAILTQAVQGQWTPDRFVQTVADSNWYKTTSATDREWITKQITDPASAERELVVGSDKIRNVSQEMGLALPEIDVARGLYLRSRLDNLDEQGLRAHLARVLAPGADSGGHMGRMVNDMFKMAHDYGYASSDLSGEILDKARSILASSGEADTTAWQSKMIDYASAYYAPYRDDIRGGKTVADIAKPVTDRVAQLLEMNPENVNLNDPLVKKAMTSWAPDGRAYTLREIEDQTRRDARWKTTDNAKQSAVQIAEEIATKFGMLPSAGGR